MVDTTKAGFLGVTVHWIKVDGDKWNMHSEVIGFQSLSGEHNRENLGWYFVGVCDHIGIIDSKQSKVN